MDSNHNLRKKYEISLIDEFFCNLARLIHKSDKVPKEVRKRSKNLYGRKDNIGRYWYERYRNISVGKYTYGYEDFVRGIGSLGKIGAFCSIAHGSKIVPNDHELHYISTHPLMDYLEYGFVNTDYALKKQPKEHRKVIIGNDVWIGANSIIFEGVHIGDGAVIGAGTIIRKEVPPYAIMVGCDRILKYRFSEAIIKKLLEIKWWEWDDKKIKENINLMKDMELFIKTFG